MSYKAIFNGWQNLALEDLLVAYRKAKADCFFENTFPTAVKFAEYEQDLLVKLKQLLSNLQTDKGFAGNKDYLGEFRLLPKKLSFKPKPDASDGHVHFSNPKRTFEHLTKNNDLLPEFRIVGDFPVESHIISALWINMIGHKFDACLDDSCYGARLKRIHNDETLDKNAAKPFHYSAIGSFAPYFYPYQEWRNDGLNAIRGELEKDRDVIAVSLDLKSYYHFIDPMALSFLQLQQELGLDLTDDEKLFTLELAKFLTRWSKNASAFGNKTIKGKYKVPGGLVIGLTVSRIISNVLLYRWDSLIKEKVTPVHYGRYVDDMFLVLRDNGSITNGNDFMKFLQERLGNNCIFQETDSPKSESSGENQGVWQIQQGKELQGNSLIKLQASKQKLFLLQGRAGLDLLDSIEKEIYELSSEHRLMPSPDQLEDSTAARVLSAAGAVGENADTLRRADGLTIRRLSWSLQLRHVETLARDLPLNEWFKQREEFYQFAYNHILRPDNLFAHFNYLPRLLGFAISLNEWHPAEQIVLRTYDSIAQLESAVSEGQQVAINGVNVEAGDDMWRYVKGTLTWLYIDAATRYYDPKKLFSETRSKKEKRLAELFLSGIIGELTEFTDILDFKFGSEEFHEKAPLVALADLAKEPYKRILRTQSAKKLLNRRNGKNESQLLKLFDPVEIVDTEVLKYFLKATIKKRLSEVEPGQRKGESYLPYLFPTRPLSAMEISELAPECVGFPPANGKACDAPSIMWAKYTQAIRGIWIKPTLLATQQDGEEKQKPSKTAKYLLIGTEKKRKVVVALTNIKTDDSDWALMACNKSNLSRERYARIAELVEYIIRLKPKPDYALFPELSLPLPWVDTISYYLAKSGISLIAGTEYRHVDNEHLFSEVCLVLTDNRLGFPSAVRIWQPKLEPAVKEDEALLSIYGKTWDISKQGKRAKPVYVHNDMHFGVMVCSELQNSKVRVKFQGEVDALMVLSWNQDLETFASLIESAALDVHAYIILVNNRKYGDSRVRSPAKESFMRDLARVRGCDNDFVIAATIDIDELRAFQSRAKRWSQDGDKFKPVPEGFKLARKRRKLPPS